MSRIWVNNIQGDFLIKSRNWSHSWITEIKYRMLHLLRILLTSESQGPYYHTDHNSVKSCF